MTRNFCVLFYRLGDYLITSHGLFQAVRSYLHFSQLSAWYSSSRGQTPQNVLYRITIPGEAFASKFSCKPEEHFFPSASKLCIFRILILKFVIILFAFFEIISDCMLAGNLNTILIDTYKNNSKGKICFWGPNYHLLAVNFQINPKILFISSSALSKWIFE